MSEITSNTTPDSAGGASKGHARGAIAEAGLSERERAYRFDLFIAPEWSARFDALVAEHLQVPTKGSILEINCGTGARAIEVSDALHEGEVVGVDADGERIAIARAKAVTLGAERCSFFEGDAANLALDSASFDFVVADASLEPPARLAPIAAEAARIARGGAPVAVKVTLRGSFDEFSSIYWEALYELDLVDSVWPRLEALIFARPTLEGALEAVRTSGLDDVAAHQAKEEFRFDSGAEFLASPLAAEIFLDEWLSIAPPSRVREVREAVERIIDRERGGYFFDVSAKALVAAGRKPEAAG